MRAALDGLPTPCPIGERLPAVYHEDAFTQQFTAALDEVLVPVFVTLDCFGGYLDPWLAPPDFLDWLATWVALRVDEGWPPHRRRELVANAVELHRWRGTRRGLAAHARLLTGGEVEVLDSGGCTASEHAGGPLPGGSPARVLLRVRGAAAPVDLGQLRAAVAEAVPAHVKIDVEIVG